MLAYEIDILWLPTEALEAEGMQLVHAIIEHILTCFQSQDPSLSLESMIKGPMEEPEEATKQTSIWESVMSWC
jgi:hypothetical protein